MIWELVLLTNKFIEKEIGKINRLWSWWQQGKVTRYIIYGWNTRYSFHVEKTFGDSLSCLLRFQSSPGLTIWMTQSCWICCLSLKDSAKKMRFMGSCRIWEAGSRTHHSAAWALILLCVDLCPLYTTSLTRADPTTCAPLVAAPRGRLGVSLWKPSCYPVTALISWRLVAFWVPSQKTIHIPGALCFTETTPESVQSIRSW